MGRNLILASIHICALVILIRMPGAEIIFILPISIRIKTALLRNLNRAVVPMIMMKNQISMMIGRIIGLRLVFLNRYWLRSFLMVDLMVAQSEILRA